MQEKFNLKKLLKGTKEDIDSTYNLPKVIKGQERVPLHVLEQYSLGLSPSDLDTFFELHPDEKYLFDLFQNLRPETKAYIVKDFKEKQKEGMRADFLIEHFCTLISRYSDFLKMDVRDSDKTYKPKLSQEELENKEIEELASETTSEVIQDAEAASRRANFKYRGADKYKN